MCVHFYIKRKYEYLFVCLYTIYICIIKIYIWRSLHEYNLHSFVYYKFLCVFNRWTYFQHFLLCIESLVSKNHVLEIFEYNATDRIKDMLIVFPAERQILWKKGILIITLNFIYWPLLSDPLWPGLPVPAGSHLWAK